MNNNAVASGSYADMKLVKTRSVCQIVVEIPIEQASQFIEMFGVPVPGSEIPVAIARLNEGAVTSETEEHSTPSAVAKGSDTPRRETTPANMAGILCGDPEFQSWLQTEEHAPTWAWWSKQDGNDGAELSKSEIAAFVVRHACGIQSRSELNAAGKAQEAWFLLHGNFRNWQTDKMYEDMRR